MSKEIILAMRKIIARGLDLCAESRDMDRMEELADSQYCATPYVWAREKYEEKLEQWERDASNILALSSTKPVA